MVDFSLSNNEGGKVYTYCIHVSAKKVASILAFSAQINWTVFAIVSVQLALKTG